MSGPNVICLVVDWLHAGYLGAYGNTWISTPSLDRLASDSLVLDRMTTDSPCLESVYRSLWTGRHAMVPGQRWIGGESLPVRFAKQNWHTALITDVATVGNLALATDFTERVLVNRGESVRQLATNVADDLAATDAAVFAAQASSWLESSSRQPFLLWLHTGTLGRVWDAPIEFRAQYHDEDDPPPEDWATVPNRMLADDVDPDELLGVRHAYAGQVSLVDQLIGSLLESIDQSRNGSNTALLLLSPRGISLAEHRRIGACDDALYAELTHVPCMIRFPQNTMASQRSQALVQPGDMFATLLELVGMAPGDTAGGQLGIGRSILPLVRGEATLSFDLACSRAGRHERRIETPAWGARVSADLVNKAEGEAGGETSERTELFVKPDDWSEANDIANRCPEIAGQMRAALAAFERGCETGENGAAMSRELLLGFE